MKLGTADHNNAIRLKNRKTPATPIPAEGISILELIIVTI